MEPSTNRNSIVGLTGPVSKLTGLPGLVTTCVWLLIRGTPHSLLDDDLFKNASLATTT